MPESVTLGGRSFPIAPLKFRDLKRVLPLFLDLGLDREAKIDAQGEIIATAIASADAAFTRAAFDELTPTVQELQAALAVIANLSGLAQKEAPPGEEAAASPSIGTTSTV